jgi:hypothetical protein
MDHDFHGFVGDLRERIRNSIILDELNAAKADLPLDCGDRNGFKTCRFTRSIDTKPRFDLKFRTMPAASEKFPVFVEKSPLPHVEPETRMRAAIHIAETLLCILADNHDRERSAFPGLIDPQETKCLGTARLDTASCADRPNLMILC